MYNSPIISFLLTPKCQRKTKIHWKPDQIGPPWSSAVNVLICFVAISIPQATLDCLFTLFWLLCPCLKIPEKLPEHLIQYFFSPIWNWHSGFSWWDWWPVLIRSKFTATLRSMYALLVWDQVSLHASITFFYRGESSCHCFEISTIVRSVFLAVCLTS